MSCFFAHVLMSFAYVCFYFVGGETPIPMQYIMDLLSFSGPICLFVTSKTVRTGYTHFYLLQELCGRKTAIVVGSSRQHFRDSG
ncbi:hypothetical protein AAVH_06034 [Aphelenchoides avenae]|nr:hypothetical protein AAVH_06034 [Aphelenchus avenae]